MAEKSSLLKESIIDIKKLKEEAMELAKKEVISQAKDKIEENTKRYLETLLFEGAEGTEQTQEPEGEGAADVTIEVTVPSSEEETAGTYIDPSDDFTLPEHPADNNEENIEENAMENTEIENTEVDLTDSPDMETLINEYLSMEDEDSLEIEPSAEESTQAPAEEISEEEIVGLETAGEEEDELANLSEEELAELERQLDEDIARLEAGEEGEEAEVIAETEETVEEPIEEASMSSDGNLKHKNLKPKSREENARKTNMDEAKQLYDKLSGEVVKLINEAKTAKEKLVLAEQANVALTTANNELTSALKESRNKLYEAAIVTLKTAHVNKLLMEHSTTQEQKKSIVDSFDAAKSRDEIKALYESFNGNLIGTAQNLNEGIHNKLNKALGVQNLNESAGSGVVNGVDISRYERIMRNMK